MLDCQMTDEVARVEIDGLENDCHLVRQLTVRHFVPLRLRPSFASPAFSSPANSAHPHCSTRNWEKTAKVGRRALVSGCPEHWTIES